MNPRIVFTALLASFLFLSVGCEKEKQDGPNFRDWSQPVYINPTDPWELPPDQGPGPSAPVPEPGAGLLFGTGLLTFALSRKPTQGAKLSTGFTR